MMQLKLTAGLAGLALAVLYIFRSRNISEYATDYDLSKQLNIIIKTLQHQNHGNLGEYGEKLKMFLQKNIKLNRGAVDITEMNKLDKIKPPLKYLVNSSNIVYNRINKAGSTTVLSKCRFVIVDYPHWPQRCLAGWRIRTRSL